MPDASDVVATVQRFALSLDSEEYTLTRTCLSPACRYRIAGEVHEGPDAIVDSYRGNGDWASRHIDRIEYGSRVMQDGPDAALITFYDHLTHKGRKHSHQCQQWCRVTEGLIVEIEHRDLPGEREALDRFKLEVGLRPVPEEGSREPRKG